MLFPNRYPFTPHLALREYVRELEGELSLLGHWADRIPEWTDRCGNRR